jgi:hypothetical protein
LIFDILRFLHRPPACRDRHRFFSAAFIDDAIFDYAISLIADTYAGYAS